MKTQNLTSIFAGLIGSGLIYFIFVFLLELSFFTFAQQTLTEWENMHLLFSISTGLLLALSILFIRRQLKNRRLYLIIGVAIPFIFFAGVFISFSLTYLRGNIFKPTFESTEWKQSNPKPFNMARGLVKSKVLKNSQKGKVFDLLGSPTNRDITNHAEYIVEDRWIIQIYFRNQIVDSIEMISPGIDL